MARSWAWRRWAWRVVVLATLWGGAASAEGGDEATGTARALVVVGLPGDAEHEAAFRATATAWRDWLVGPLRFPADGVRVLFGQADEGDRLADGPATREAIRDAAEWAGGVGAEGRLWVLVLGHANQDGEHTFLHLPGPDLRDDQLSELFRDVACREQVFWLTTAASGGFVPPLAKEGRIVIAATARDREPNETEFPHALADVARMPPSVLDRDGDGRASVWEVFLKVVEEVAARYAADKRAPTEHAQLDDDGDGHGVEAPNPGPPAARPAPADGARAEQTFLPRVEHP